MYSNYKIRNITYQVYFSADALYHAPQIPHNQPSVFSILCQPVARKPYGAPFWGVAPGLLNVCGVIAGISCGRSFDDGPHLFYYDLLTVGIYIRIGICLLVTYR